MISIHLDIFVEYSSIIFKFFLPKMIFALAKHYHVILGYPNDNFNIFLLLLIIIISTEKLFHVRDLTLIFFLILTIFSCFANKDDKEKRKFLIFWIIFSCISLLVMVSVLVKLEKRNFNFKNSKKNSTMFEKKTYFNNMHLSFINEKCWMNEWEKQKIFLSLLLLLQKINY